MAQQPADHSLQRSPHTRHTTNGPPCGGAARTLKSVVLSSQGQGSCFFPRLCRNISRESPRSTTADPLALVDDPLTWPSDILFPPASVRRHLVHGHGCLTEEGPGAQSWPGGEALSCACPPRPGRLCHDSWAQPPATPRKGTWPHRVAASPAHTPSAADSQ